MKPCFVLRNLYNYHNLHLRAPAMIATFSGFTSLLHPPSGLPAIPAPAQFWTLIVWFIIPSLLGIWAAYAHHISSLRRSARRVRQLELRLAQAKPMRQASSLYSVAIVPATTLPQIPATPETPFPGTLPELPRVPLGKLKTDLTSHECSGLVISK